MTSRVTKFSPERGYTSKYGSFHIFEPHPKKPGKYRYKLVTEELLEEMKNNLVDFHLRWFPLVATLSILTTP